MTTVCEASFGLFRAHGMATTLAEALREATAAGDGPRLVQARVASGMWME